MKSTTISIFCGLLVIALMAGNAFAARNIPITQKARPDYDPIGIYAGGFTLKPELSLGLEYNDNIYATDNDEVSDWITTMSPRLRLTSNWSRHALNLDAGAKGGLYADENNENYIDAHVLVDGRVDFRRESFLSARAGFQRLHEERGDPDSNTNWDEPATYYKTNADLAYYQGLGKFSLTLGTGITSYDFNRVDLVGGGSRSLDYRDRDIYNVNARIAYDMHPEVKPFITSQYEWRRYDEVDPGVGVERDSEGYRIGVGTGFDLGGIVSGEVYAGYMNQDYDHLKDVDGPWYGMDLLWTVTQLTSLQASVQRSVKETTTQDAAGIEATDVNLRIDHELLRNLLVGAFFDYTYNSYEGIDRTDRYVAAGPRVTYLWNRYLSAEVYYRYKQLDTDSDTEDDYTENLVALSVTGRF
jgi:hypothetical protein